MSYAVFSTKWADSNGVKAAVINIAISKPLVYKNEMCNTISREWTFLEPQ